MANEGFSGMADLIADLERMPEDVQTEAAGVIDATADLMQSDVVEGYPSKGAELRGRVVVEKLGPLRVKVRSKAPHAHLYEFGTVQRHLASNGANRGTMPAKPVFVPAAVRARKRMVEQLVGVVKRQKVRGMTGTMEVRER